MSSAVAVSPPGAPPRGAVDERLFADEIGGQLAPACSRYAEGLDVDDLQLRGFPRVRQTEAWRIAGSSRKTGEFFGLAPRVRS